MASLPEEIIQSISIANAKSVAEQPSTLANLQLGNLGQNTNQSQQNAVSMQQTLNNVQATVLGKIVNMLTTVGPLEAVSTEHVLTGNSVAEEIGAMRAVVQPLVRHQ